MSGYIFMTGTYPLAAGVKAACECVAKAEGCSFIGPLTGPSDAGRWWFVTDRPGLGDPFDRMVERAVRDRLRADGALDERDMPRRAPARKTGGAR